MKVKSLLVAGTVATTLGVSAFLLPASVFGTTIDSGNIATYADGDNYKLTAGDYELNSDLALGTGSLSIEGAVTINYNGHKITASGVTVPAGASLTLSGNGGINCAITSSGTLTINGGVYDTSESYGGPLNINGGTINVKGGSFIAGGASAAYFMGDVTATITDGTFTSSGDNGIEAEGNINMTISGGTFTGGKTGISLSNNASLKLSGGTFTYTNTTEGHGAIAIFSGEESAFNGFLASGYKYDKDTVSTKDWYGMQIVRLEGPTVKVQSTTATTPDNTNTNTNTPTTDNKKKVMEEMSKGMEKVIASSTSKKEGAKKVTTTAKKAVKAPNTGVAR